MIKNRKVATKLTIIILPLIATILFQVIYNSNQQKNIYEEARNIYYDHLYESTSLLINSDRDFYQANLAETTYFYGKDLSAESEEDLIASYEENVAQTNERFGQALAIIKEDSKFYNEYTLKQLYAMTESDSSELEGIESESMTAKEIEARFLIDFSDWQNTYNMTTKEGDFQKKQEIFEQTRGHINAITDLLTKYSEYESSYLKDNIDRNVRASSAVIAVIFAIALLISVIVSLYLRKNIKKITLDMEKLSNNDLSFEPYSLNAKDELGKLSKAVGTMYGSIRGIMSELKASSDELVDSSQVMHSAAKHVDDSLGSIHHAISDIARTSSNLAEDADEITKEMSVLNDVMEDSVRTTATLTSASRQIEEATSIGMNSINELMNITESNNIAFDNIFEIIDGITRSTEKIGEASRLISQIADQTNLLSLNASIEAARAGEAGAGFAIVASEIRQLAEQSANSVNVIDEMLSELQGETERANIQSAKVKDGVKTQNSSVTSTKERYVEIVENIKTVNNEISSLENVNHTLESNFSAMNELLQNLAAVSQEAAATTQELTATTGEITTNMNHIKDTSDSVDGCAKSLWEIMNKFQLD